MDNSLPYLTYLSIFSYHITSNGELVEINDEKIINNSLNDKVVPIMVITNIVNELGFNSDLAHEVLINSEVQETLLNNVIDVMKEKGYYGLNIDFEYVYETDKENYNSFISKASDVMHSNGYFLTTSLAPKTSSDKTGLLYYAHDYEVHGKYSDHVILMTYEWGYRFGEPQGVAPLNKVEEVIKYATSVIPSGKILLGIPNYGYDWTLPFNKNNPASSISNSDAINLAIEKNAEVKFDEIAKVPYFNYKDENNLIHIVYFDDARSLEEKLKLVKKYNLGGISYWNINNYFYAQFFVLSSNYKIKKLI